jgi:protein-tyrosine phosphatase
VETEPDRLPDNPQPRSVHLPVEADIDPGEQFQAIMFNPHNLYDLMKTGYTQQMIEANAPIFGACLRHLADPANLPAIIHCTAGKDRTGVAIALLLAVLEVADETIIADYSLSNQHFPNLRRYIAEKFKQPYSFIFGVTVDDVQPILTADPALMRHTLDYIRQQYGTVEQYLQQKAGLDDTILAALRDNLLM